MKVSILHIVGSLHIKRHIFYLPDSIVILIVHDLKLSSRWRRFDPRHWNTFQKNQQLTIMQILISMEWWFIWEFFVFFALSIWNLLPHLHNNMFHMTMALQLHDIYIRLNNDIHIRLNSLAREQNIFPTHIDIL